MTIFPFRSNLDQSCVWGSAYELGKFIMYYSLLYFILKGTA
ncbi:hypothetical protein GMMP1_340015 [Candidatus Magnetomoraceae bacterium gMMP-1]